MQILTAWRISLRARLPESGWRPKRARVAAHFEIWQPLRQERTSHRIAEQLPNDGQVGDYRFVHRISTDKRACDDWSGQPRGGRLGNYPGTRLWETITRKHRSSCERRALSSSGSSHSGIRCRLALWRTRRMGFLPCSSHSWRVA